MARKSCSIDVHNVFGPTVANSCLDGFDFTLLFEESVLTLLPLLLTAEPNTPKTRLTLPATAIVIASFVWLLYCSFLEQVRSVRPSTILCLYLGLSSLLDLAISRTSFFIPGYAVVAPVQLTSYFVKLFILAVEVVEKRRLLVWHCTDVSPEALGSFYNRVLFLWLNPLLLKGYRTSLTVDNLTPLDQDILGASRPTGIQRRWKKGQYVAANKSSKRALLWVFICHYKWDLLAGVLPRITYVGFAFVEPFLMQRVLDFTAEPEGPNTRNLGYGLIGAYALVQIGKSLSLAWYEHMTYRVLTMFRGSLISLIYDKTLRLSTVAVQDAEAITLVSADIDRIGLSCLAVGIPLANATGNAQVPWLEAIEKRLAVTSRTLGTMKSIRMAGLTEPIYNIISSLRAKEVQASRLFRLLSVLQTGAANCTFTFAPVLGLGAFVLLAKANNTGTLTEGVAFAVLGLFQLQDRPVMSLLHGFEDFQTIVSAFHRVQIYISSAERQDCRAKLAVVPTDIPVSQDFSQQNSVMNETPAKFTAINSAASKSTSSIIILEHAAGGYSSPSMVVKDLNLEITRGMTTMVVGPVGSGKSTFLRLLLGELPQVSGTVISDCSTCAFSPQSPWITWGTVRSNILGMSTWDSDWYNTVVRACSLDTDFKDLPDGDQTRTGAHGSRLSGGQQMRVSLARALYSRSSLIVLDDVLTGLDRATETRILEAVFGRNGIFKMIKSTVILATNSVGHLRFADHIIVLSKDGVVDEQGTLDHVTKSCGHMQRLASLPTSQISQQEVLELSEDVYRELGLAIEDEEKPSGRQTSDLDIYTYYIRVAGARIFFIYLLICAAYNFGLSFPSIWLQWWTKYNTERPNEDLGYWLGVYFGLAALAVVGCMTSDWAFRMLLVPKTSRKFHKLLLDTTMHATTTILTSTNVGSIINRFSQDLQLIDSDLPQCLDETVLNFLGVIVSAVLVFTGSGYVAAALPICIALVSCVQKFYLRTSRQLRLLDIEAKAPLFSHLIETLNGLPCIRAYGWCNKYMERTYDVLDASQKPYYLLWCIQRWLNLVLDLLVGVIAVMLVAFATMVRSGSTGFLGVALFSVISFSGELQTFVTQWTQLETALGAISRVKAFVEDTTPEPESSRPDTDNLPDNWPSTGSIVFDNISASYEKSSQPVLKGFNLVIKPGEKIALCGRTGSGKSSLLLTILGMLELEAGTITIDGYNTSRVSRGELRKRLNTLPQEPFFLQGNVRDNVDPLRLSTDERIIEALCTVRLWEILENRGGLGAPLNEDELSHGQRQLFCLARAIARPGKIVIVDEATSSVDSETDELMQRVLREELQGRTLIAVAHKLHTVLEYDRIVLIDKGSIVEIGKPRDLLEEPNSAFYKLYTSTASDSG
ncbi:hypothetical protein E4U21_004993 [Claviceps maximensis]|nr:hypothetical protein E4U21_004993 [Claviceps maximensis]